LRAIRADPTDSNALYQYAIFLEKSNKLEEAEEFYLRALEADPNNTAALHEYGNFLAERGEHADSENVYRRCSENSKNLDIEDEFSAVSSTSSSRPLYSNNSIDHISPNDIYRMR